METTAHERLDPIKAVILRAVVTTRKHRRVSDAVLGALGAPVEMIHFEPLLFKELGPRGCAEGEAVNDLVPKTRPLRGYTVEEIMHSR